MGRSILALAECLGLFLALPLAIASDWVTLPVLPVLALTAIPAMFWLFRHAPAQWHPSLRCLSPDKEKAQLRRLLIRFIACIGVMTALIGILWPARLFSLPLDAPGLWLSLVLAYPILSVYPQEVLCRSWFFFRYRRLFPDRRLVAGSALAFAAIHMVYGNIPALLLTAIGGYFFAETYARTSSFRLVWLEHSLYGVAVFTIGFGPFFDRGDSWFWMIPPPAG